MGSSAQDSPSATSSPVPHRPREDNKTERSSGWGPDIAKTGNEKRPVAPPQPTPKQRLYFEDLTHESSYFFINAIPNPNEAINIAISHIITYLYTSPSTINASNNTSFKPSLPGTRSVTLILNDFSGVAFTTGTPLDSDHKEIHISLSYVTHTTKLPDTVGELTGVITHELVHCYQHTKPTGSNLPGPPPGLIEGIADFVRLKAGLSPPHWKRPVNAADRAGSWDAGYQHTAYFLEWLENIYIGTGAVGKLNDQLLRTGYVDIEISNGNPQETRKNSFWKELFGHEVTELWDIYGQYLDNPSKA